MARKTPSAKNAGKKAASAAKGKARKSQGKPSGASSGAAKKKSAVKPAVEPPAKKARAAKAARRAAARKAAVQKTSLAAARPSARKAPAAKSAAGKKAASKTSARKTVGKGASGREGVRKQAGSKVAAKSPVAARAKKSVRKPAAGATPQPAPRRAAPRISAGRRAKARKATSREALAKKTLGKPAAARKPAKKPARKRPAKTVAASGAKAAGKKTARSRIVGRASTKLTPPVLRDAARRRVEKPTAPRPQKRAAPGRKPPFRLHGLGVRDEHATDRPLIEALLTETFGRDEEAGVLRQLRDDGDLVIALVAEYEGDIIGHIAFSRVEAQIDGKKVKAVALAPLAVLPSRQGRGVGSVLVSSGLEAAGAAGYEAVFVVGEAGYYQRFGFSAEAASPCESVWKDALLGLELKPGALAGARGALVHPAALTR